MEDDQKEKFKVYHQAIYKDIEKSTNDFLEFAEAKGAFNWQAGQYSQFDVDFGHLARPEDKKMFERFTRGGSSASHQRNKSYQ